MEGPEPLLRPVGPFVEEVTERSPSFRQLLEELAASDVIVHVRMDRTLPQSVSAWLTVLTAAGGHRQLLVRVRAALPRAHLASTLGHELWHALEIARMPSVVDARTLAAAYAAIGVEVRQGEPLVFETDAAIAMGKRVKQEFLSRTDS